MHNSKTFLAVIPARAGSKRLPGKNIKDLKGQPLISWSIEAALKSKYIDKVVVTSDNDEILDIASSYGSETIERPDELASDLSTTAGAVKHVIENSESFDYVILLQPTSPLRTAKHIDEAIELLELKRANAVISVSEVEHSPLWCNTLPDDGSMSGFISEAVKNFRSQDLPVYYRLNGAIYIVKTSQFLAEDTFMIKENVFSYVMGANVSIDVDSLIDFKMAEFFLVN